MTHICVPIIYAILCIDMFVVRLAPCHYLNQCWHTRTKANFSRVHIKILTSLFYSRKAFENIISKTMTILSQHKCVKLWKSQMLCEHPIIIITKINIDMSHHSMRMLTHLPKTKQPPFRRRSYQMHFHEWKNFVFWFEFHWSLFLRVQLTISQHWFR